MRALRYAGSWWTSAILVLLLAAPYGYFASGVDPYEKWLRAVFHTLPGMVIYVFLVLNIAVTGMRVAIMRLGAAGETIKGMDALVELPAPSGGLPEHIALFLGRKGFSIMTSSDSLSAQRGRMSFLPGAVLRAGLVIFMVSLALSIHLREEGEIALLRGESGTVMGQEVRLVGVDARLPEEHVQVGESDMFELGSVSARLEIPSGEVAVTAAFPLHADGLYWRITHLGYYQPLTIGNDGNGVYLDLLPPGRAQDVPLGEGGRTMRFTLWPEKTVRKGLLVGKLYDLAMPRFGITFPEDGEAGVLTLRPGEARMAEGVPISLGQSSLWVRVLCVRDPALSWVRAGILLVVLGAALMLSRFFWYERRVLVSLSGHTVLIGFRSEFYRRWGVYRFYRWVEELNTQEHRDVKPSQDSVV